MRLTKIEINGFKSFEKKDGNSHQSRHYWHCRPKRERQEQYCRRDSLGIRGAEQQNLRGVKMEDVIFGGTQNRSKKAFCEVYLSFDNEGGRIASDYSEITIGRKMFRSGESEYYLNGNSLRLKDILDIIRDTGIGKEGYSIVGQGRIDEILASKPLARRKSV